MQEEIIRKLNKHLDLIKNNPLDKESYVVYLLVEIRKVIDRLQLKSIYPILRFYCNWTLHIEKSRDNNDIIDVVKKMETSIANGHTFTKERIHIPADDEIFKFMGLEKLKIEMVDFFREASLPEEIFQESNWFSFKDCLVAVLIDQPIILKDREITLISYKPANKGVEHIVIKYKGQEYRFINVPKQLG